MMRRYLPLFILFSSLHAQPWIRHTAHNSPLPADQVHALSLAPDGTLWIGTGEGLASLREGAWTVYDTANSSLPDPYVTAVAADGSGAVWIGTAYAGIARLAGGVWSLFDSSAAGLTSHSIFAAVIGPDGAPWFATHDGVVHRSGETWTNLKEGMIEPRSRALAFDRTGALWAGTYDPTDFRGYLEIWKEGTHSFVLLPKLELFSTHATSFAMTVDSAMYVGTGAGLARRVNGEWCVLRSQNSPLPASGIGALAVTGDTLIIATASGVAEVVNGEWTVIRPSAGGLPNDAVRAVVVDADGRRWLGTMGSGLVSYRREDIVTSAAREEAALPRLFSVRSYPNPFNPAAAIAFTVPSDGHAMLTVYNSIGQRVATLFDGVAESGVTYERTFDGSALASGVYFALLRSGEHAAVQRMSLLK